MRRIDSVTTAGLHEKLLSADEYDVFHFIGHGEFDEAQQTGRLIFEDGQGRQDAASVQDLRRLLGEVDKLEAFREGQDALRAEDVAAVLGRGMARPLYLLSDAIAARGHPRASVRGDLTDVSWSSIVVASGWRLESPDSTASASRSRPAAAQ